MAYCFSLEDRSARDGLRRIATEELEDALRRLPAPGETLTPEDEAARIHAMRKDIKKLRGLLRLVEGRFDGFKRENALLRDAARGISGLRDAEVLRQTLGGLAVDPAHAAGLDAQLAADQAAHRDASLAEGMAAFGETLRGVAARVPGWDLRGTSFDLLEEGLASGWKAARKTHRQALSATAGREELFHDWRKAMKAHWYHARLLAPIWPEMMTPHVAAASAICDALGRHHDLSIFRQRLLGADLSKAERAALDAPAAAELDRAERQADAIARKLLAEKPKALSGRWRQWWEAWRG